MNDRVPVQLFVTGTGTGVGKTLVSAIITEALQADYWKPVQAGYAGGTDSEWIRSVLSNKQSRVHPEQYRLDLPASPHISARNQHVTIDLDEIVSRVPGAHRDLVVEGAGGLMVPLNEHQFVADLVQALGAKVILVSRNYLGSINHSLLTAMVCQQKNIPVAGWIFNDNYLDYEQEIVKWSGYPYIASIPFHANPGKQFVEEQAHLVREKLLQVLC